MNSTAEQAVEREQFEPRCPHIIGPDQEGNHNEFACRVEPLRLASVLERFSNEAVHGVCDTGRYRCRYFSWGDGPPLIFVHGLSDDAASYIMPIARLSENFRCISYEQPEGNGDGAHLGRYHHSDLVADLFSLMDHLHMKQAYLLGSSFGSTVALAAMHREPKRIPRGVLQGGFARRPLAASEEMLASWGRYWPWKMDRLPWRLAMLHKVHFPPFANREPDIWQYFLQREGGKSMEAIARRALILNQVDLRGILPEIRQPILLVCGEFDPLVNKSCERELMVGLPKVLRAELAGCGHIPYFTHPEAMSEAVRRFLQPGQLAG